MSNCSGCSGSCSSCGACGSSSGGCPFASQLYMGPDEVKVLRMFGQTPFLPVARRPDNMIPVYLEDDQFSQDTYSLLLQLLEKKMLISIDYDAPLKGADMGRYRAYKVHGSMALTQRGQSVLDLLDTQGIMD